MIHTIPLDQTFERVREWLPHFQTLATRRHSQALWQAICDGEVQIHLVQDNGQTVAAVGTRAFDHPEAGRVGELTWVGGKNLPAILAAIPQLEQHLAEQGCSRVIVTGRLSWSRLLAPLGYGPTQITLEKSIAR